MRERERDIGRESERAILVTLVRESVKCPFQTTQNAVQCTSMAKNDYRRQSLMLWLQKELEPPDRAFRNC